MIDKTTQKQLLESGLSLKEYVLLSFLQQAPDALRLQGVGVKNKWCYELTINQVLQELPILQVGDRQIKRLLKNLETKEFIKKYRSKFGFYFSCDKNVTTQNQVRTKMSQLGGSSDKNVTTGTADKDPINISILNKYNTLNNINITNKEDEEINSNTNNKYPYCAKTLLDMKSRFESEFPGRNSYVKDLNMLQGKDIELLITKVKESPFLLEEHKELGLNWLIEHYDAIICDYYEPYYKKVKPISTNFEQRTYTKEQLDTMFDSLDDIELGDCANEN